VEYRGDEALEYAPADEGVVGGCNAFGEEGTLEEVDGSLAEGVGVVGVGLGLEGGGVFSVVFLVDVAAGGGVVG